MVWLTLKLKQEIREVFEPKYGRSLSNEEILEIGETMADFFKGLAESHPKGDKMKMRLS